MNEAMNVEKTNQMLLEEFGVELKPITKKKTLALMSLDFSQENGGTQLIVAHKQLNDLDHFAVALGLQEDAEYKFLKLTQTDEENFDITQYTSERKKAKFARFMMGKPEPETEQNADF